ncbi:MAG: (d)CMP kinase [Oscillospiraceae bacterium]|nr:(d)CMP kinase [Oscillospiraceae bacterium]
MEKNYSVAIDGPSGAGKSTLARRCAERFGFLYVDTGAIYRTVGLAALRAGIAPDEPEQVLPLLTGLELDLRHSEDGQHMFLGNEDVNGLIRTPEVSAFASKVSAIAAVRAFLMDMQRSLAERNSVIMDGRDIGTVVLPQADIKVFLTASPEARAQRRLKELQAKGAAISLEEVLRDMKERDERDSQRAAAPLKAAEDAVLLDTTELSLEQSIEALSALISGVMNR